MKNKLIASGTAMKKIRGFTLIELLVVIAIIAILAAILFPVFARARENARRSSCQSNLKQMGLAIMQYTQDYDEKYPFRDISLNDWPGGAAAAPGGVWITWNTPNELIWAQTLHPYHKSLQVFRCPSMSYGDTPVYGHYGANIDIMPDRFSTPVSMAEVPSPSTVYMAMDAGAYSIGWWGVPDYGTLAYYVPGGHPNSVSGFAPDLKSDAMNGRHFNGVNVAFADGHVKWLRSNKLETEAKIWAPTGQQVLHGAWNRTNTL